MPRPTTKNDLMTAAKENYEKLNLFISKMTEKELNTPFDFSMDEKKKEEVMTAMIDLLSNQNLLDLFKEHAD